MVVILTDAGFCVKGLDQFFALCNTLLMPTATLYTAELHDGLVVAGRLLATIPFDSSECLPQEALLDCPEYADLVEGDWRDQEPGVLHLHARNFGEDSPLGRHVSHVLEVTP